MLRALCFHAERLHEDRVWQRLNLVLSLMNRRDLCATFFIYPFRSVVAGKDITSRVRYLLQEGHEIGQHTHFYAGTAIGKPNKRNDLSDENVRVCIRRDYDFFTSCGAKATGFCAGAWTITDAVFEALVDLGFEYDCSARTPVLAKEDNGERRLWLSQPEVRHNNKGALILLPTTHSLRDLFRFHRRGDGVPIKHAEEHYQLVYLHDYDLLRANLTLSLVFQIVTNRFSRVREIAGLARDFHERSY